MGTSMQFLQPGESIQRQQTAYSDDFTDNHGRRFCAHYDTRNMRPKEELRPVGFNPPWLPPMRFIKWDRHGGFRFSWDYETMANELMESAAAYYTQVTDFMLEHMKEHVAEHGVPQIGDPVPALVTRTGIGSPPLSPAVVLACQAGEPWALGTPGAPVNTLLRDALRQRATNSGREALSDVKARMAAMVGGNAVPERVIEPDVSAKPARSINDTAPAPEMAEITYNEFVASCRQRGKLTMAEIVTLWREHKELAAA